MENQPATKILPHAIALAEATHNRKFRLDELKRVRTHQHTESAEGLAVAQAAYSKAKRAERQALAVYDRARGKALTGKDPDPLDEDTRDRLARFGWNF